MIKPYFAKSAFTLAELLIALAILGVIATFTIPKILDSGTNSENNAKAKEFASMMSGALQAYKLDNGNVSSMTIEDLLSYMNYVARITNSLIDVPPYEAGTTRDCSGATSRCHRYHSGALSFYATVGGTSMTTTDTTAGLAFWFDPDGIVTNSKDSIQFWIYANGKLRTAATMEANTYHSGNGPYSPQTDPTWFSWSN